MVAVLTVLGLGVIGLALRTVVQHRVDSDAASEINQTLTAFRDLAARGTDPATGDRYTDADVLLDAFLDRALPPSGQGLVAVHRDGSVRSSGDRAVRDQAPALSRRAQDAPRSADADMTRTSLQGRTYAVAAVAAPDATGSGYLVVAHDQATSATTVDDLVRTFVLVSLAVLVLVIALAWSTAGRVLLPLRRLRATAELIGASDLTSRVPESGTDDVASLQRTVNAMLDRLERAFASQRGLLDDVGHELRTPLTVLRGHLEILDAHQPSKVDRTRELLLDEVARMSRLVEDLLLLAQTQRPDFLRRVPVRLDRLVDDVVSKAEVMAPRTWVRAARSTSTVELDDEVVTQALLQLVDNAVRHTADGGRIEIGAAQDHDAVRLWVHDDGPGVAAEDRDVVFQRFGRGRRDREESDDTGHHGLGLSIVAAIAAGHGGHVELDPDAEGARFVLVLPAPERGETRRGPA
ncbi:MAG: HAMP domain-containing histidine kinase [Actinomycetales bacterium]|nr:MAG: HAMP domain-containing histidine kinase [Actinomycetales bacterium]